MPVTKALCENSEFSLLIMPRKIKLLILIFLATQATASHSIGIEKERWIRVNDYAMLHIYADIKNKQVHYSIMGINWWFKPEVALLIIENFYSGGGHGNYGKPNISIKFLHKLAEFKGDEFRDKLGELAKTHNFYIIYESTSNTLPTGAPMEARTRIAWEKAKKRLHNKANSADAKSRTAD